VSVTSAPAPKPQASQPATKNASQPSAKNAAQPASAAKSKETPKAEKKPGMCFCYEILQFTVYEFTDHLCSQLNTAFGQVTTSRIIVRCFQSFAYCMLASFDNSSSLESRFYFIRTLECYLLSHHSFDWSTDKRTDRLSHRHSSGGFNLCKLDSVLHQ
jgi:hypothetical protein